MPFALSDIIGEIMTEENAPEQQPVKSGTDLAIEQMQQQIADMKTNYEAQVKELSEANKDLWSALHPVKDEGRTYVAEPVKKENLRPQADVVNEMVRRKLGLNTQ